VCPPEVTESGRKGFGSSLIRAAFERELREKTDTKFEPDGLYGFVSDWRMNT
jgi:hypothetical protein